MPSKRPAYRPPWTDGAKAYPEADSLTALEQGGRGKRKSFSVRVKRSAVRHLPCVECGIELGAPYPLNKGDAKLVTDDGDFLGGTYDPKTKTFTPRHYYCSWGSIMADVVKLGRRIQLGGAA